MAGGVTYGKQLPKSTQNKKEGGSVVADSK